MSGLDSEDRRRKRRALLFIGVFIALSVGLYFWIGEPIIAMVKDPEAFRVWAASKGLWGKAIFVAMVLFQVVVAFVPGEPLEIAAGYAFGPWQGALLCLIGIALGSALVCWISKKYGTRAMELFFSRDKIESVRFLRDAKRLNLLVFLVFFIPGTPKDILTYAVGLTPMPIMTFLGISSLARIPSVITSTLGGDALGEQKYVFAIAVFAITLAISGVGLLIYNRITSRREKP